MKPRTLERKVPMWNSADGDGVKIRRIGGEAFSAVLDPFLLIDEIRSDDAADYIGGFPPHPHRGMETVTLMLQGAFRHQDHLGNEGVVAGGGAQWMSAGRGVIHSEMPEQENGILHGFQLWLNLPASEKMDPAQYRDIPAAEIPRISLPGGGALRLLAGTLEHASGQLQGPLPARSTEPLIIDLHLPPGEPWHLPVPEEHTTLVLPYEGATDELEEHQVGIYQEGSSLGVTAADSGARLLILAGKPLREPVKQYGPFVMNTEEELEQALADYRQGTLVA